MKPILTIIVTYNGEKYIRRCLQCLRTCSASELNQTLVIDNNSSDDTCGIIEHDFPEVELIRSQENLGFGKANNIGMKEAVQRGADFLFLLNQDAYVDAETISCLHILAAAHPHYGILSPLQLNGDGSEIDYTFYPNSVCSSKQFVSDLAIRTGGLDDIYSVYFTNAAAWFMPSHFLKKVGGFAPIFPHYGEDNDFINRCHYHGFDVGICPKISICHDRPQQAQPFHNKPISKISRECYVRSLIILTNVQSSLREAVNLSIVRSIRNQIIRFHIKKIIAECWGWYRILQAFPAILRTRRECRQTGATYLQ
jgi:GT2 family glycosyltransferase